MQNRINNRTTGQPPKARGSVLLFGLDNFDGNKETENQSLSYGSECFHHPPFFGMGGVTFRMRHIQRSVKKLHEMDPGNTAVGFSPELIRNMLAGLDCTPSPDQPLLSFHE